MDTKKAGVSSGLWMVKWSAGGSDVAELGGAILDGGLVVEQLLDRIPVAGNEGIAGGVRLSHHEWP
ncbi:MAG: hypothetical protein CFE26_05875 [Verrucomicrobiales bacterium VVV1]|nr:MAG: hypothetical protein CFE26_05875 [Verrucomicrobiales bacterium VVV1]